MKKAQSGNRDGRILFRGQGRVWPTIKPSIARGDLDKDTRSRLWNICYEFNKRASGLTGYRIQSAHDRLCILQHYIRRSPVIDLTGTPEIALYFAIQGSDVGQECVVYSVDRVEASTNGVVFSDHDFLVLPPKEGGFESRWVKQNGFTVGPEYWCDQDEVDKFDMLELASVRCMRFTRRPGDLTIVDTFGNLESTKGDLLVGKVRWIVDDIIAERDLSTCGIRAVLKQGNTYNPDDCLVTRISGMIAKAKKAPDRELIDELEYLRAAHERGHWDTSFLASLLDVERRLT